MSLTDELVREQMSHWLDEVIPEHSYLDRYMRYADPLSDAPRIFNFACGLATLSAAIGRNITYQFGDRTVPANIWILLLAPTGTCRKTTAMSTAKRIIQSAVPKRLYPNEMTPEAMLQLMAENPQGLMTHSEFAGFMARLDRGYMAGMKETLTDLYDAPEVYTRKLAGREPITIRNPSLSMLAGSTISWLVEQMKEADLRGGWLARFLMIPVWRRENFIAIPPRADMELNSALISNLKSISQFKGQVDLTNVGALYTEWLWRLTRDAENGDDPEIVAGFVARLSQSALKIAILIEASGDAIGISEQSLKAAILFIDHVLADTRRLLRDEFATSWVEKIAMRISNRLNRAKGNVEAHSPLLRFSGLTADKFNAVINWMDETHQVEVIAGSPKMYKLRVRQVRD